MENVCKDQVEEIVEFELSGKPVEGAINASKGCEEKVNIPAADHQLPSGGEIIHCKHGTRKVLGLGTRRSNAAHNQCKRCMLPGAVVLFCNLWAVSVAVRILDGRDALRCTRHIVGSPCNGSLYLDARRLPADQPPHHQHQSVDSRKPNWCER